MARTDVAIGLLGPLEVSVGGDRVEVPRGRVQALLAVLALSAGETVAVETLAERVWGADLPANVRASLHTYVMRLRRLLGEDRVMTSTGGYRLDVPVDAVDALRFLELLDHGSDSLREALALWRGTPFEPSYSDWLAVSERAVLVERRLAAVERLADLTIGTDRTGDLIGELQDLAQQHPLRESLTARLLMALDGAGRSAEALAAYESARAVIVRDLGVAPGPELQRMHADLLAGNPLTDRARSTDPPVRPRQLPADVDDFSGRDEVLRTLDSDVSVVLAVHGPGGVGKTALVVHWARRSRDRFPDGQLFVDLRGYGPGEPMAPADALDAMLRGLGVPGERIPRSADARGALLRTTLSDRRVLVVLDNARDAEHVRPLLPGAGTVVVTSRSRLRELDGRRIGLDVLPAGDARAFLADRLKRQSVVPDEDSLARLAELCGYLPLALTVAAERAGLYPDSPLADLVEHLRDERDRLDVLETGEDLTTSLRAVMSWSYRALDPGAARLFRRLGSLPGADIGIPAAAALAGIGRPAAGRLLDRLAEAHLLGSPRPGRFAMHDLVRMYAAERAADDPPAERDGAARRLYQWYALSAGRAHSTLSVRHPSDPGEPGAGVEPLRFDDERQAMTWFDSEQQALPAVITGMRCAGLHREVCQLVRAICQYYVHVSRVPAEVTALHELALDSARLAGDELSEAQVLNQLGVSHCRPGEFEVALPRFEAAHALYRKLDDAHGQVAALGNVGFAQWHLGNPAAAIDCLERAIALGRRYQVGARLASALTNLAEVYNEVGRRGEAELAATEAIGLQRAAGKRLEEAFTLDTFGTIQAASGDHARAASHYGEAADIFREIGSHWDLACALRSLGLAQYNAGDPTNARASWEEALRVLDQTGAEDSTGPTRQELLDRLAALP